MKKRVIVLGVTGQDGSYMVELLLKKQYEVHGIYRKSATSNTKNINHLLSNTKIYNKICNPGQFPVLLKAVLL